MTLKKQKDAVAPKPKMPRRTTKTTEPKAPQATSVTVPPLVPQLSELKKSVQDEVAQGEKTIIAEIKPIVVGTEHTAKEVLSHKPAVPAVLNAKVDEVSQNRPPQHVPHPKHRDNVNEVLAPKTEQAFNIALDLSGSLGKKLRDVAREEGITVESFARELIAEGLLLRAFEIADRRNNMRQGSNPQSQGSQGSYNNNRGGGQGSNYRGPQGGRGGQQQNHRGGNNQNRRNVNIHNLMEDKASFIEYVRSQEKKRR